jgi:hypothetical protein
MKKIILIGLIAISCRNSVEEKKEMPTSVLIKKVPSKMFAGIPDLPKQENEITSAAIGKIIIGEKLSSLNTIFDSVVDMTVYKEGGEWQAKKIILGKSKWIIAESVNAIDKITYIETNSDQFKTTNGCYVGMSLDSISSRDSIVVIPEKKVFSLYHSGVGFSIDNATEKFFFKSKNPDLNKIRKSKVASFFILCGDC